MTTTDPAVLASAEANIDSIINAIREGNQRDDRLRLQIPRIMALAEQYDLIGWSDTAAKLRQQADALGGLRYLQDQRDAEAARKANRWYRRLFGKGST